jgi:hypothetical protein
MRMTTSLVFDETRLTTGQAVAHKLDLATSFWKASGQLKKCQQRTLP